MDKYVKTVIETAITHTEYRESTTITLRDVLESFKVLGRPVYWNSEIAEMDDQSEQIDGGNHFICLTQITSSITIRHYSFSSYSCFLEDDKEESDNGDDDDNDDDDDDSDEESEQTNNINTNEKKAEFQSTEAITNNKNNDTLDEEDERNDSKLHIDCIAFK